jgi:hypothetical protein
LLGPTSTAWRPKAMSAERTPRKPEIFKRTICILPSRGSGRRRSQTESAVVSDIPLQRSAANRRGSIAFGTRGRNVQPIEAIEELHSARGIRVTRARRRIDRDRRLLSLELVHCADAGARQALLNLEDLRVVGRDDDNVVERDGLFFVFATDPGCVAGEDRPHETADCLRLFRRAVLVADRSFEAMVITFSSAS